MDFTQEEIQEAEQQVLAEAEAEAAAQAEAEWSAAEALEAKRMMVNIASEMSEEALDKIGRRVSDDYDMDKSSRADWEKDQADILELAQQITKTKSVAGTIRANVKHPILQTAVIQFHARAYPNIIKGRGVVKGRVIGRDPEGLKAARATRQSIFMNHQFLEEIPGWEEGMDQLTVILPLAGCVFKKTYHDGDTIQSELVLADDLVANYYTKTIETATRLTHRIWLTPNEIEERIRSDRFVDFEYLPSQSDSEEHDISDDEAPHEFLEQHRWLDLDEDGYQEPYIVMVHEQTKKVVRITARWEAADVFLNDKHKIAKINPTHHFTQYTFMYALDGSFYRMGFGALLAHIARTMNTTINQLLDAGSKANAGGGFIGKSMGLGKGGTITVEDGKWKYIKHSGDDLRKNLVPYPLPQPSAVLFSLLVKMEEMGKELVAMSDASLGQNPPTDQPATTTLAVLEQGMKVFTGIYKRIHRGLRGEAAKVSRLNSLYLDEEEYQNIVDDEENRAVKSDWRLDNKDIVPVSDSADLSDVQRIVKAQALMAMKNGFNDREIDQRNFEAMGFEDTEKLIPPDDWQPPQDPKFEIEQGKLELESRRLDQADKQLLINAFVAREKAYEGRSKIIKNMADAEAAEEGAQLDEMTARAGHLETYVKTLDQIIGGLIGDNTGAVGGVAAAPGNGGGMGNSPIPSIIPGTNGMAADGGPGVSGQDAIEPIVA